MQSVVVNLTRAQLEAKRTEAAAKGFTLTGDDGEIEAKGVKLKYTYAESIQLLTIDIEHVDWVDIMAGHNEEQIAEQLRTMLTPPSTV